MEIMEIGNGRGHETIFRGCADLSLACLVGVVFKVDRTITTPTTMSAEANIKKSKEQLEKIGVSVNDALLEKVVKGLGIANQSKDASLVSGTDQSELDRVRTNFLGKKLGLGDQATDEAVKEVVGKLAEFNQKQRGAVYYLLTEKFGKQDVYGV